MTVSASGVTLGGTPGCCLYHHEGARWLLTLEALGQQLENWGLVGLAYQLGSLQIYQTVLGQQSSRYAVGQYLYFTQPH